MIQTLLAWIDKRFRDFNWREFSVAVGAAFASIKGLCATLAIAGAASNVVALVAAGIAAVAYIRQPRKSRRKAKSDENQH